MKMDVLNYWLSFCHHHPTVDKRQETDGWFFFAYAHGTTFEPLIYHQAIMQLTNNDGVTLDISAKITYLWVTSTTCRSWLFSGCVSPTTAHNIQAVMQWRFQRELLQLALFTLQVEFINGSGPRFDLEKNGCVQVSDLHHTSSYSTYILSNTCLHFVKFTANVLSLDPCNEFGHTFLEMYLTLFYSQTVLKVGRFLWYTLCIGPGFFFFFFSKTVHSFYKDQNELKGSNQYIYLVFCLSQ